MPLPGAQHGKMGGRTAVLNAWPQALRRRVPLARPAERGYFLSLLDQEMAARRLFIWLPVLFGLGIILHFQADGLPQPTAALVGVSGFGILAVLNRRTLGFIVCLAPCAILAGFAASAYRTAGVAAPVLDRPVIARVSGFIESVERRPDGARLLLYVTDFAGREPQDQPRRVRATLRAAGELRAGDHIVATARLLPPPQPAQPNGYDFAREAYFQQVGAVGRLLGTPALAPPKSDLPRRTAMLAQVDNARNALTDRIAASIGGPAGALAAALVTGKRGYLTEADNQQLRVAGLYHIVSISGLHMVLAAGAFFWLARALLSLLPGLLLIVPVKKIAAVIAMVGASAYCVFSGAEVATERSLIMTLVMFGAIVIDRPALTLRNLAIAALIVMARQPETVLGPSFQMSFAAVTALVAAAEWWRGRRVGQVNPKEPETESADGWTVIALTRWPRRILTVTLASLATTLIATLATAPFSAFHFHQAAPLGLIGNALAIPFVSLVVMPSAVLGVLLLPFGLDQPVWWVMGEGCRLVMAVAGWVAGLPGAEQSIGSTSPFSLAILAFGFLWLVLWTSAIRLAGLAIIMLGLLTLLPAGRPDILIDRAGALVAVRDASGHLGIVARRATPFVVDQWLAADADSRRSRRDPVMGRQRCDSAGCVANLADGRALALVLDANAFAEDCRRAAFVVTPLVAPAFCRETAVVYDRESLALTGALRITLKDGRVQVEPTRPPTREKPWYGRKADKEQLDAPASAAPGEFSAPRSNNRGVIGPRAAGPGSSAGRQAETEDHGADPAELDPGPLVDQ